MMATAVYISHHMAENDVSDKIFSSDYLTQTFWYSSFTRCKAENMGIILKIY
jgi:hypothetical protein